MSISSRLAKSLFAAVIAIGISANIAHAAAGRTKGSFNVSATGAATYQIPIWMPPGPNGIQPHLAITYSSHAGDDSMGPGWSLVGLSAITRCNKTYAQDSVPSPVALAVADGYCLNGNRLRLASGSYGTAGSTYQTELADFSLITANGVAGNGPAAFTVQGKDGLIYEYGNTTDSRILATSSPSAAWWLLNKVRDRSGNNYIVTYGTGQTGSTGIGVPMTISYTPSSSGSSTYNYTVNFNYGPDSAYGSGGVEVGYVGGTLIKNTNLLTSVTIKNAALTVLRKYSLSYQPAPTTTRARLSQVKECADDAQTDCLSPTAITYQDQGGQAGLATPVLTGLSTNSGKINSVDINGDGRADLVYATSSGGNRTWYVQFADASGALGSAVNTGLVTTGSDPVLFDDFLSEGRVSLLAPQSGTWYLVRWNGTTFAISSTGLTVDPNSASFTSADIDGDGRPDLVSTSTGAGASVYSRLNTSAGGTVSFSATLVLAYTSTCSSPSVLGNNTEPTSPIHHYDFNGDGREDVALACTINVPPGIPNHNYTLLVSQGSTFFAGETLSGGLTKSLLPLMWNDDECTDVLYNGGVHLARCNGAAPATISVPSSFLPTALDWDGDGRTDLLLADVNAGIYQLYRSTGDSFSGPTATTIPTSMDGGTTNLLGGVTFDPNGDGLDEVMFWQLNSALTAYDYYYSAHNGSGVPPDLVTSITDGYGVANSPTYVSIAQSNYTKGSGATYPEKDVQSPMYVVSQVTITDPSGAAPTYTQSYTYAGARANYQGRGFLGFQTRTVTDSRANAPVVKTYFKTTFPYTGMVYQQDVYQSNGTSLISRIINTPSTDTVTTLDATANNQRYFPYIANSRALTYEVSGAKNALLIAINNTSFTYDTYGNLTQSTTTLTDNDLLPPSSPTYSQSWTTTVANTITPNTANWCLGLPTQTVVTKSGTGTTEGAISRTTNYTPDYANCRMTQQVVEPNSATYKVTTDLGYDSFGNVNSQTVTGINMTARTTTINWGATGQFPISVTNPLLQLTAAGYDYDKGVQTSQTDPNGIVTSWQYDSFARKTLETRPDTTTTTWSYNDCASVSGGCQNGDPASSATGINKMVVIATNKDTGGVPLRDELTYLDQLGRPIVTKSKILSGGYSRTGVQYDSFGRQYRQTAPCDAASCTAYWNTFAYDVLNRVTQIQRPISGSNPTLQTTTVAYQGMTTVTTDPQSKATTKVTDPNGWMRRSQDANGYYQDFSYDAFGSLRNVVDSSSNALFSASYVYGVDAFQTQTVDMDLGTWNYTTIDALGEVLNYTDANGAAFAVTYDKLSRPLTKFVSGDGTTTFTYGNNAAGFNIGQLLSINNTNGTTENYTYDNKGRLSQRQIVSDATYNYDYAYDATTGLLDTLTYPTSTSSYRLALKYVYQYGLQQQVKDNAAGTIFWQANTMNPRGQITQEALGNGIVTNRSYDAVTGWVNSIQSGVGGGTGVQNEAYLFDKMGNVIQRQNNTLGLTESFCYDNVYRLIKSALSGDATCTTSNNLTVGYDNLGNITNRSDVAGNATWTYDPSKKHAVTQAGNSLFSYTYDANGNALTRYGFYTIGWNKSNYPTSIAGNGETDYLYYDGNNRRWKQEYVKGGTTETTIYVGGLLEKVTTGTTVDWRHYIKAGNQTVAVYSRQSTGTNTLRYMLEDHQGSVAKITDSAGATYVSENFSAFGNRRNPATWSGAPPAADLTNINAVSRVGYTGQDFLGSLGLNHMNGRVQDAITGRFLSADPYVTEPGNTQNYNRYSYVYNNPFSYVDPSGFGTTCFTQSEVTKINYDDPEIFFTTYVVCVDFPDYNFPVGPIDVPTGSGGGGDTGPPLEEVVVTAKAPCLSGGTMGNTFAEDSAARRKLLAQNSQDSVSDAANAAVGAGGILASVGQSFRNANAVTPGTIGYRGFDGVSRSFPADTGAQTRALNRAATALNITGTTLTVIGAGFAGKDVLNGYASGNKNQMFSGSYGLISAGIGLVAPEVAIGMAIAAVAFPVDDTSSVFDRVPIPNGTCKKK